MAFERPSESNLYQPQEECSTIHRLAGRSSQQSEANKERLLQHRRQKKYDRSKCSFSRICSSYQTGESVLKWKRQPQTYELLLCFGFSSGRRFLNHPLYYVSLIHLIE